MIRPIGRSLFAAAVLALTVGCLGGSRRSAATTTPDFIGTAEIQATTASSAYDIVNRLRPQWLRTQRAASMSPNVRVSPVLVYLDGSRVGGLETLRTVSNVGILSMEYLGPTKASTVLRDLGTESVAGAILIKTRG